MIKKRRIRIDVLKNNNNNNNYYCYVHWTTRSILLVFVVFDEPQTCIHASLKKIDASRKSHRSSKPDIISPNFSNNYFTIVGTQRSASSAEEDPPAKEPPKEATSEKATETKETMTKRSRKKRKNLRRYSVGRRCIANKSLMVRLFPVPSKLRQHLSMTDGNIARTSRGSSDTYPTR